MPKLKLYTFVVLLMAAVLMVENVVSGMSAKELAGVLAGRLEREQIKSGTDRGSWPHEANYTGSIVAGLVSAYRLTCNMDYKACAELGGTYILSVASGNFYGDEAFALTQLSRISDDPTANSWRTSVSNFYRDVKNIAGTDAYVAQFAGTEPSTAVFYIANHVVAAYYVDAKDKKIWRQALIDYLAQVDDDTSDFPVMALGIATWALAGTGPLNDTLIDPTGSSSPYWVGKKLSDLPELLASHIVPEGKLYAGSFYWRFDHGSPPTDPGSGYTEDTIFPTLGLTNASLSDPNLCLEPTIAATRDVLITRLGLNAEGIVRRHLWLLSSEDRYTFSGEALQALGGLTIPGDMDTDGDVDFADFALFANSLCMTGCERRACGPDLNEDGQVNSADMAVMASNWLKDFAH